MLMHATARGGCTDVVREPALEADSGRTIIRHTGESNSPQYCVWIFAPALCQLSYPTPSNDNAHARKENFVTSSSKTRAVVVVFIVIFVLFFNTAQ